MRVNVYSQELITDEDGGPVPVTELVSQISNTGITYSAVRLFLHSSFRLHHPPADDDRSAITFWLPRSSQRRTRFANVLRLLADMIDTAPPENGLD